MSTIEGARHRDAGVTTVVGRVTVYVPPASPECVVLSAMVNDLAVGAGTSRRRMFRRRCSSAVHRKDDETVRLWEDSPPFDPERFAAHPPMPSLLPRTYLVTGTLEPFFHENATRWATALREAGADVIMTVRVGTHGDPFWRQELPRMVAWAFGD